MKPFTGFAIFLTLALISTGCSSSRVFQTSGSDARVKSVSDVQVTLKPGALDKDAEEVFQANSMSGALRTALTQELRKQNRMGDTGAKIHIEVTSFRMRSGVEVFWIGVMAGNDYLAGTVTVKEGEQVLKSFEASAKGSESAWSGMALGRVSSNSRADLFCRMIAKKVVKEL